MPAGIPTSDPEPEQGQHLHHRDRIAPLVPEQDQDYRLGEQGQGDRERHADHQHVALRGQVGVGERPAVDAGHRREQHQAGNVGEVDYQQLRKPEAERVEAELRLAEHPPDGHVVDLVGDRRERVEHRQAAPEPQQPAEVAADQLQFRPERDQNPEADRERRRAR